MRKQSKGFVTQFKDEKGKFDHKSEFELYQIGVPSWTTPVLEAGRKLKLIRPVLASTEAALKSAGGDPEKAVEVAVNTMHQAIINPIKLEPYQIAELGDDRSVHTMYCTMPVNLVLWLLSMNRDEEKGAKMRCWMAERLIERTNKLLKKEGSYALRSLPLSRNVIQYVKEGLGKDKDIAPQYLQGLFTAYAGILPAHKKATPQQLARRNLGPTEIQDEVRDFVRELVYGAVPHASFLFQHGFDKELEPLYGVDTLVPIQRFRGIPLNNRSSIKVCLEWAMPMYEAIQMLVYAIMCGYDKKTTGDNNMSKAKLLTTILATMAFTANGKKYGALLDDCAFLGPWYLW